MYLNLLFQFMDNEITNLAAWVIFRPGDILFTTVMGHAWLLRCTKTMYEENARIGPYFEVHCIYTDHDGKTVGVANHKILLIQKQDFGAENPATITELPIPPKKYAEEKSIEKRLEERGDLFLGFRGYTVQSYDGLAQYIKEPPWSWWHYDMASAAPIWLPYTETGRVVLDKATFQEDYSSKTPRVTKADPEPLLCPSFTIGCSLAKKEWCHFLKLVLEVLVTSHSYPENARDQPEQKGKGLVVLLHGSPGSGKTLSAESSAELTHRALTRNDCKSASPHYRINPFLSSRKFIFECNLWRLLQYATLWKAIVVLDEADVFLEMREEKAGNAERNALVAIFLRELEYFSGIIFLTTNRVETFDWAMKSRIYLALRFLSPGATVRQQMWTQALRAIPAEELGVGDVSQAVEILADRHLNGREIYSTLNTARTIATFEHKKLLLEYIQKVLKVRDSFDKKLTEEPDDYRSD
ncbi:hypothetical protein NUW58_g1095 [Xylaria curta]|uniref:Uncharacterized protein n=1 Tax=Xylaria curta TaxID=42375 RepID=A0ACC1PLP6_9PEZI|nr:hypothetical protein NUW58_g1095 [Xylaria curta]